MKKIHLILFLIFVTRVVLSQSPNRMSFQAVMRSSTNALVLNKKVEIKISILKDSLNGSIVFTEKHSPISNNNGAVTMEIGGGVKLLGTIDSIDWSKGPYFIKTEVDLNGSGNYSIVSVSQFLSVPYALYAAKSANGFSGNYKDLSNKPAAWDSSWISIKNKPSFATVSTSGNYNDLINKPSTWDSSWISIKNKPSFASVAFSGNYNDLINKPVVWDSSWNSIKNKPLFATVSTSGSYNDLINKPAVWDSSWASIKNKPSFAAVSTSGNYNDLSNKPAIWDSSWSSIKNRPNFKDTVLKFSNGITHYIGELYGGGVVAAVWKVNGIEHGLIAALADIPYPPNGYSNISSTLIGPLASSYTDGKTNTSAIINQVGHISSAAYVCDTSTMGGQTDWYLPAAHELMQCYNSIFIINEILGATNGFKSYGYFSSTETGASSSIQVSFISGTMVSGGKASFGNVRAVRRF